jgi:hypothetical protein
MSMAKESGKELVQKVTLRDPIDYEDKHITQIVLDFGKLRGKTLREAESRYHTNGGVPIPAKGAVSLDYCIYCAVPISGIPYGAFDELDARDYTEVAMLVQSFLLDMGLVEESTPYATSNKSA